ncbi:pseudouridine-5'-monophosphatase/sugar-phosphatase [Abditibacterium utsteinense]|uniref:Pseudouridine-5'-monophosphatase/sugar-phosphatase n=1 Tax=Abditibacterium utsteinense TaxID=1960156 RepID=A0A2S8SW21_9BACT|nr:HAD family phosphatase [Abditibacterium utsteinense]PQV64996.1 pseudouridine-5'-monophosphatase/sugar-phosphatase [Abditibacterium utsteinense]
MIQAILFDCDGVIADSEAHWNQIDRAHLAHFGVPDYDGRYKEHVIGKSFTIAANFYKDTFGLSPSIEELIEQRTGVAARFYAEEVPIFPGVSEVLVKLKSMNLKLALATSSVSRLITPFLKRHDIEKYFDVIVTGEMVKNGKPHPDIYRLAAQKCGVATKNALVVEDALAGLEAGRGAGATTVAIPDARWMDPALFQGQADYIVAELREVLPLVRSLLPDALPKN